MRDNGTWRLTPGSTTEPRGSGPGGGEGGATQGLRRGCCESVSSWSSPACRAPPQSRVREGKIGNSMRNILYKGCFCHSQEFVMGTILSLCNCSLENVLFLIKAT